MIFVDGHGGQKVRYQTTGQCSIDGGGGGKNGQLGARRLMFSVMVPVWGEENPKYGYIFRNVFVDDGGGRKTKNVDARQYCVDGGGTTQ